MMLVVLAVTGLMVLVVTVAPPDQRAQSGSGESRARPPQLSDPDAFDATATLSAEPGRREQTIEAELGDRVEIVVEGSAPDNVALGEMRTEPLDAETPARFELLAETPGSYPLVLLSEDRRIGSLEIR
jgi:hypothetical protein